MASHEELIARETQRDVRNRWLLSAPALLIILLASIGLWPDPNPNPIGPGLLFFVTFWPALACFAVGGIQTWRRRS